MAIQLYRKGTQAEIRGLMVDIQNFIDIHGALQLGWCMSPEEAYKDELNGYSITEEPIEDETIEMSESVRIPKKKGRPKSKGD